MNNRPGFASFGMLMLLISLSIVGMVATPRIQSMYEKMKVDKIIEKEKILKNVYVIYFNEVDGNYERLRISSNDVLKKAIEDKLVAPDYTLEDGFGGNIEFSSNGLICTFCINKIGKNNYVTNLYNAKSNDYSVVKNNDRYCHSFSILNEVKRENINLKKYKEVFVGKENIERNTTLNNDTRVLDGMQWQYVSPQTNTDNLNEKEGGWR